jgi:hypothetical protein
MSNRERWIVYPLLFLSIGLGLRKFDLQEANQEGPTAEVDTLRCKTLEILAADGKPRLSIGTNNLGEALLETSTAGGKPLARINSNASGAALNLFDRTGQSAIRLGYDGPLAMLLVMDPANGEVQQLFSAPILPVQLDKQKADATEQKQNPIRAKPDDESRPPAN